MYVRGLEHCVSVVHPIRAEIPWHHLLPSPEPQTSMPFTLSRTVTTGIAAANDSTSTSTEPGPDPGPDPEPGPDHDPASNPGPNLTKRIRRE